MGGGSKSGHCKRPDKSCKRVGAGPHSHSWWSCDIIQWVSAAVTVALFIWGLVAMIMRARFGFRMAECDLLTETPEHRLKRYKAYRRVDYWKTVVIAWLAIQAFAIPLVNRLNGGWIGIVNIVLVFFYAIVVVFFPSATAYL